MRPAASSRSMRCLLARDQPEPGLRGASHSIVRVASSARGLLSIQPKHSASSTDSAYSKRGRPVAFLNETSHTPCVRTWWSDSHARQSASVSGWTAFGGIVLIPGGAPPAAAPTDALTGTAPPR